MNIRMAAVAACALALGATPAAADVIGTVLVSPSVVQTGETTFITLRLSGDVYDQNFYFEGAYWEALPWANTFTFYDGIGGSEIFASGGCLGCGPPDVGGVSVPVTYPSVGTFFPHFDAEIIFRLTRARSSPSDCPNTGHAFCLDFAVVDQDFSGSVTVNAVPAPLAGAGLPGLILAFGGVVTWWRRRLTCRLL